ncbi:hypothetical protein AU255_09470 [Methyloprofundus sedimenti]|uniref:Uncharacterized protein n=1 Tax=Methyloprofundus sedimenti TaxID=1420851 RepID=A0A1V8M8W7_9GAMM|nr:hypothetical protein [Methyloprofundus sedimenti]OQK18060.1 hypothetical protein AU255_09470 [Methyloprofundus sedimenti]
MVKTKLDEIIERLRVTQQELEAEIERLLKDRRELFHYNLRRGKVVFERNVRRLLRQQRTGLWSYLRKAPMAHILSSPIIYSLIVPLVILDISISFFQHTCFRIYGIPLVNRSKHIVIDRHRLPYLNAIESLNCVYCGYGNGLIAYTREVIARTEQYWCPIKHAQRRLDTHERTLKFVDYGDVEGWRKNFKIIRHDWSDANDDGQKE